MKNKYFIINKEGQIVSPSEVVKSNNYSAEFRQFVSCEINEKGNDKLNRKSDYLKYAHKMGFSWEENSDSGFANYDFKANLILRILKEYARSLVSKIGFPIYEVRGSNIFDLSHPVVEAYAKLYGDRLFQFAIAGKKVVMSYDASYPQFNLAGKHVLSYKSLPFAHFSISDCYRLEQSGELLLLWRQRRFFMPDLHPYFRSINEAFEWYPAIEKQILEAVSRVNRKYFIIAEVGSNQNLKDHKDEIAKIAKRNGEPILVKVNCDNASRYWIVNVDYKIIDKLGQSREIACIQIDVDNAKRLGIKYRDEENEIRNPIIIHAAVPGGFERFLYMVFDDFKKCFPIWLHPIQLRLIPVSQKYIAFCKRLREENSDVRIDIDERSEVVSKRIKMANEELVPHQIVIGQKEADGKRNIVEFEKLVKKIKRDSLGIPFIQFEWPYLVSRRI